MVKIMHGDTDTPIVKDSDEKDRHKGERWKQILVKDNVYSAKLVFYRGDILVCYAKDKK
jgi:hypothetical protein